MTISIIAKSSKKTQLIIHKLPCPILIFTVCYQWIKICLNQTQIKTTRTYFIPGSRPSSHGWSESVVLRIPRAMHHSVQLYWHQRVYRAVLLSSSAPPGISIYGRTFHVSTIKIHRFDIFTFGFEKKKIFNMNDTVKPFIFACLLFDKIREYIQIHKINRQQI